ncbi:hexosaminidase [Nonomuraea thailandensis]|uniref:Hexosaminidase n=1 Tax=Nonomuraea thailandensis TaxID=1188745 RepID=A0A9X2GDY9_9ACTN|nr:DUF4082 domain-containing protein [Nonomuraea thailandensis]MCP2353596.1 hexosaminidase [Nonomuraea thailandensis]
MSNIPRRRFLAIAGGTVAGASAIWHGGTASAAAAAGLPAVIPAIRSWTAGSGTFSFSATTRIVVSSDTVRTAAEVLAEDLKLVTGQSVPVVAQVQPAAGDISLKPTDVPNVGKEGYELSVGPWIEVRGTPSGVFFGTRTLVQWLRQARSLPGGLARDWPRYPERGLLVANVPKHFSMTWWRGQIQELSYLKMNLLWIYVGYDSTPLREMTDIAKYAARYNIAVVPQLNMPDHMGRLLYNRPDLQLRARPQSLDLSNPEAYTFAQDLVKPLLNQFDTPHWHLGSDEYLLGANYSDYPQLANYAKQEHGPDAIPQDVHHGFINQLNEVVRAGGKTMRVWNDGIYPNGAVQISKNVVIEHWVQWPGRKTPQDFINEGYSVANSNQDFLYYDPGTRHPDPAKIYNEFRVGLFHGTPVVIPDENPRLLGAKLHLWTLPDTETEEFQSDKLMAPLRSLAQVLWGSPKPAADYTGFSPLITTVGRPPGFPVMRHTISPIDGTTSLWPHRVLVVRFYDSVDPGTIQLTVSSSAGAVPGSLTYDAATKSATFKPNRPWDWDTLYTASLTARDYAGHSISPAHQWSFRSAKAPTTAYPRSIWPDPEGPAVEKAVDGTPLELGVKFRTDVAGQARGVRFYKAPGDYSSHVGSVWTATGTRLARATFTEETAAGWQEVRFPTPVRLQANTTYVVSYSSPGGVYGYNDGFFASSGVDNGVLHALSGPAGGGNGVFATGVGVFPSSTFRSMNYWADVLFDPDEYSIWDLKDAPAWGARETQALEIGVKFQATTAGRVRGVRFWKGTHNTGTHIGSLWTGTGTRLASATFTGESAGGWQTVRFTDPVQIQPNTTYIVSYSSPTGAYSAIDGGLTNARVNGALRALSSTESGGNGVFALGAGVFPTRSYQARNYFVDAVFSVA